jgi:hypothetical protein
MARLTRRGIRTTGELGFGEMSDDAYAAHKRPWRSSRLTHTAPGRSIAKICKLALDLYELEDYTSRHCCERTYSWLVVFFNLWANCAVVIRTLGSVLAYLYSKAIDAFIRFLTPSAYFEELWAFRRIALSPLIILDPQQLVWLLFRPRYLLRFPRKIGSGGSQ